MGSTQNGTQVVCDLICCFNLRQTFIVIVVKDLNEGTYIGIKEHINTYTDKML